MDDLPVADEILRGNKENSSQEEESKNPLWDLNCKPNDHLWDETKESNDLCKLGEKCQKRGIRRKCLSCRITCHEACKSELDFPCRTTYGGYDNDLVSHHLVERRRQEGKCSICHKSFQKFFKDATNYQCTWCKELFHKHEQCLSKARKTGCDLGMHRNVILPPNWITKTPTGYKVTPCDMITKPLVVLINPKSGGKKGAELMKRFQFLLNPRQVFNVFQSDMDFISSLFKDVENLRYLVCGGDGTAGIVMNDLTAVRRSKPLAILPLGTGNDLARTLGWGSGYNDEPLSKIISAAEAGEVSKLDRWDIKCTSEEKLPLSCFNNYFSLGTDAATALAFHNARTQNPAKFQNRIFNKMFYVKVGSIDLVRQAWKNLWECISLECDGVDLAEKLKAIRPHVILFLNIPRYSAGTLPWGSSTTDDFKPQSIEDGLLEVIGLSSASLAGLHIGGHGERIAQCRSAVIKTTKTVPFQIDGEPFTLEPVSITIEATDKADVIFRPTRRTSNASIKNAVNCCTKQSTD